MATSLATSLVMVLASFASAPSASAANPLPDGGFGSGKLDASLERTLKASAAEPQEFWVSFTSEADTSGAVGIGDWKQRGEYVVDRLRQAAQSAQADTIAVLDAAGVEYTSYWVTNAIRVHGGDYALARHLAANAAVAEVFAPVAYERPEPIDVQPTGDRALAAESVVEWGIRNVHADQVWREHAVRGDGIVVANIDTGVQFDHPALVGSYRGNNGDGTFTNDYNWLDVTGQSPFPVDGHGHGTHTMGTMVGDDGAANQVGVAPGVTWIAANGCCPSDAALVASAQWMLAPTKVDGSDPRPELRPNIVNNSWGSTVPSNDPFMPDIVQAWADAGIFGVFANGNHGPGCQTSGFPGSRTLNYSVGAYDSANQVAGFSSRGPGQDGEVKPNISAPGVDVRSSYPGGQYAIGSGTSMATPHVAGTVALLWSADPSLIGDIAATRALLDQAAIDTADDQCGGTAEDNNVYGEGRLDALGLLQATDPGPTGTISGTVTGAESGEPVAGASVELSRGAVIRSTRTDSAGGYTAGIAPGEYTATVTAFGYEPTTVPISVTEGGSTVTDISLPPMEGFDVSGRVLDARDGDPVAGATVTLASTLFEAQTDDEGRFTVAGVPGPATYTATIVGGGCLHTTQLSVTVESHMTLPDTLLDPKVDQPAESTRPWGWGPPYGYTCTTEPTRWIEADTPVEVSGGHETIALDLPFPFTYFGHRYRTLYVLPGAGLAGFELSPLSGQVIRGMYVYNDSVRVQVEDAGLLTRTTGTAPNRAFTLEWRNVEIAAGFEAAGRVSFQITLHEDGDFVYAYADIDPTNLREAGNRANVLITDHSPDGRAVDRTALTYSSWEPVLGNERQIRFTLPPNGFVNGTVVDRATGQPVPDATVDLYHESGDRLLQTRTDDAGSYRLQLFTGQDYRISTFAPPGYQDPVTATVRLTEDREERPLRMRLDAALVSATPGSITLREHGPNPPGRTQITLTNRGTASYEWWASAHLPGPDSPDPGTMLGSAAVGDRVPVTSGAEEVNGTWWVSGYHPGEPIPGRVVQITPDGQSTGASIDLVALAADLGVPAESLRPRDMAWVPSRGWLCLFVHFSYADQVVCVDPEQPGVAAAIPTGFGEGIGSAGLAYDPDTDRFFASVRPNTGGYQVMIRTMAGVDHAEPGQELNTCLLAHQGGGLAYNPTSKTLWTSTIPNMRTLSPVMLQVDPTTCAVISSTEMSYTIFGAGGPGQSLDVDPAGNLVIAHTFGAVSVMQTDDPIADDIPWLTLSDWSGSLERRSRPEFIRVGVDWDRVPAGVNRVNVVLRGNGGADPTIEVPVLLQR